MRVMAKDILTGEMRTFLSPHENVVFVNDKDEVLIEVRPADDQDDICVHVRAVEGQMIIEPLSANTINVS